MAPRLLSGTAALALVAAVLACVPPGRVDRDATKSATDLSTLPAPATTGVPSRTVDSTGFVDNAGRTSDMTARTELSGMRATEVGSVFPTGTPGSGAPLPIEPRPEAPRVGEGAGAGDSIRGTEQDVTISGIPWLAAVPGLARARCDREVVCGRVGADEVFESADACVMAARAAVRDELFDAECPEGIDRVQLAICLNAVRRAPCDASLDAPAIATECSRTALCMPR